VTAAFESFTDALSNPKAAEAHDSERFGLDEIDYRPPTTERNSVFCAALNY
jgi:hypothetical protein